VERDGDGNDTKTMTILQQGQEVVPHSTVEYGGEAGGQTGSRGPRMQTGVILRESVHGKEEERSN